MRRRVRLLAIVAVVALLFAGCYVHREIEKRGALKAHAQLMALLVKGESEQAYLLTTRDYQAHHSLQEFAAEFPDVKDEKLYLTPDPTVLSCYFGSAEIFA